MIDEYRSVAAGLLALALFVSLVGGCCRESAADIARRKASNMAAMAELKRTSWVEGLYVTPEHLNIAVARDAREWGSPEMKGRVCGVLEKHGSELTWVRFMDAKLFFEKKSAEEAEIVKVRCRKTAPRPPG